LGVPKEIILIESNSITIADNVKTSLNLMDNLGIKYQRIATVGAWFMQRRAWSHLIKLSSAKTKIFCTNAPISSPDLKVNTWFTNEVGIKTIFGEFVKLKLSVALNTA